MNYKSLLNRIIKTFFSTTAGTLYTLCFAIAIGAATFIENDFGTSAAQKLIYRTKWFELLLIFFSLSILYNIFSHRLIQTKKYASLIFHCSIIIILLGSAITRYFGYEGIMHIREGKNSNQILSSESNLNFKVISNNKSYTFSEEVLFSSLGKNNFNREYIIGSNNIKVKLIDFIPNPIQEITEIENGKPVLKLVVAGANGREEHFLTLGDYGNYSGTPINFSSDLMPGFVNIQIDHESLKLYSDQSWSQMVMATQQRDTLEPNQWHTLKLKSLHSSGRSNFVVADFVTSGKIVRLSRDQKIKNESLVGLQLNVTADGTTKDVYIEGRKGEWAEYTEEKFDKVDFLLSYGSKYIEVPFEIKLNDFILERYPGTENASSYASEVTLMDSREGVKRDQRIYMNHVLDYKGYRFFQSSFDPDEKGTYLSVNHDFWGTWISYIGYIMLTIGLILIFFTKRTRFSYLNNQLQNIQKLTTIVILLIAPLLSALAIEPTHIISRDHADRFGKIMVQDQKGRIEPINTLANEVIRKISRNSQIENYSAEQIFITMGLDPQRWENEAIIHSGSNSKVLELLGVQEGLIKYVDFFDQNGQYKLKEAVRTAQTMNPKDQGVFEKAIIKIDEKVNIVNMLLSSRFLKIFPVEGDLNNTWISSDEVERGDQSVTAQYIDGFYTSYIKALTKAFESGDYTDANKLLDELKSNQSKIASAIIPSESKIKTEIFLNKMDIFGKLRNIYGLIGLLSLFLFIVSVVSNKLPRERIGLYVFSFLGLVFIVHTLGLAMRWYVSGHAPWSNGYESMIYIGWTTMLAGLIFSRKSLGGLTATSILAFTILLVAGMSWLDPEITPLVPVLKSYWLTIHVSLEAGSYGFLMLGAVIGMLNMVLILLTNVNNKNKIQNALIELSIVSEITITGGLIMVSIGTYLGGVWANESWGRYWGWDAKETWALVTILVYAFILHMRFIPGMKGVFTFNCATLFGFATVIMTYYGVNYYLSGLHSYAAGDPVPIPPQVYITASVLSILSIASFIKYRKWFSGLMV